MFKFLHWVARWPLWITHAVGGSLGWLAWAVSPSYRRLVREHAQLAGIAPAQRNASVAQAGRMVVELPRLWLRPQAQGIADPLTWEGAEALEAWLAKGRGTLIFTPHMGSFEIAAQAYAERFGPAQPLTVLYRPARQRWLRELEATARERKHLDTAPADLGGVRQMLRALKRGQTVGLLPDQVPPAGLGVWAPFFGREAYTMTLGARLAQQTGAAVGALWCERLSHGRGYVVHVRELTEPVPPATEGEAAAAAWVNRCMESLIKECPQQYLWGYNRYKHPRQESA